MIAPMTYTHGRYAVALRKTLAAQGLTAERAATRVCRITTCDMTAERITELLGHGAPPATPQEIAALHAAIGAPAMEPAPW